MRGVVKPHLRPAPRVRAMSETVTISVARLQELEAAAAAAATLKERLKKANHCDPERLKAYNKAHPEKGLERVKKYQNKDRDAYNARRRELRRLKKEAVVLTALAVNPPN